VEVVDLIVTVTVAFVVAYNTVRLQVWSAKEQELRALLDRGTAALPDIRLKLGWSRSDLELADTIDAQVRRRRLEQLDAARVAAEEVADLLLTHAGRDALVNIRFRAALDPAREARNVLVGAADGKIGRNALDEALGRVDEFRAEFDAQHNSYLSAAHDYMAKGGRRRRALLGG
jgi:hypothetical protein